MRVRVTAAAPVGAQAWFVNFQSGDLTARSNLVLKR
jgi:hypothetical protein